MRPTTEQAYFVVSIYTLNNLPLKRFIYLNQGHLLGMSADWLHYEYTD